MSPLLHIWCTRVLLAGDGGGGGCCSGTGLAGAYLHFALAARSHDAATGWPGGGPSWIDWALAFAPRVAGDEVRLRRFMQVIRRQGSLLRHAYYRAPGNAVDRPLPTGMLVEVLSVCQSGPPALWFSACAPQLASGQGNTGSITDRSCGSAQCSIT